jgi:hypothetical protein
MRAARLGDDIDDFCVKCKRVMNHAVVSILNDAPAKVRCRTCHSDHDFRNEQPPPPKVDPRKAALFNQVLGNVTGLPPEAAAKAPVKAEEGQVAAAALAEPEVSAAEVTAAEVTAAEVTAAEVTAAEGAAAKPKGRKKTKA